MLWKTQHREPLTLTLEGADLEGLRVIAQRVKSDIQEAEGRIRNNGSALNELERETISAQLLRLSTKDYRYMCAFLDGLAISND